MTKVGRRGGIRTRDPLHPMQVRYQAALHAEQMFIIARAVRPISKNSALRSVFAAQKVADFLQLTANQLHGGLV